VEVLNRTPKKRKMKNRRRLLMKELIGLIQNLKEIIHPPLLAIFDLE
jgi:hypothetical protein